MNNLQNKTRLTPKEIQELLIFKDKELERYKNIIDELEEELERETNIKEEDTGLEHNTYIDINQTLKKVLNRLKELKGE